MATINPNIIEFKGLFWANHHCPINIAIYCNVWGQIINCSSKAIVRSGSILAVATRGPSPSPSSDGDISCPGWGTTQEISESAKKGSLSLSLFLSLYVRLSKLLVHEKDINIIWKGPIANHSFVAILPSLRNIDLQEVSLRLNAAEVDMILYS